MQFEQIKEKLEGYKQEGKRLFTSSSFQSHSLVMLHILSRIDASIPVYFLNTGYHFPETLAFRDKVASQLGIHVVDLKPSTPKYMQTGPDGRFLFTSDPDYCCHINKTRPMDEVLKNNDVWINGIRGDQSATREAMKVEQPAPHDTIRFHPMLDWTAKMIHEYRKEYQLPKHPLEPQGYLSIGCEPCTRKFDLEMQEREARWYGMSKSECGLHTDLAATS